MEPGREFKNQPSPIERENKENLATTYIDLARHGNRFGGAIEVTVDGQSYRFEDTEDLTEEGKAASQSFGQDYPEAVTLVHARGGDTPRHLQTAGEIRTGSGKHGSRWSKESPIPLSRRTPHGELLDYKSGGIPKESLTAAKQAIAEELKKIVQNLSPEEKAKFVQPENRKLRAEYREQAQLVGLGQIMNNETAVRIAAENEAHELMHFIRLSRRGVKAGETKAISMVGSGMFAESLLKHALVVEDINTGEKKVGFTNVSEIGGFVMPGTAFRIKATRDTEATKGAGLKNQDYDKFLVDTQFECGFTDKNSQELFAGKKLSLDWDKVQELAAGAAIRLSTI